MKSAEEILNDHLWMGTKPSQAQTSILEVMKEYARQCCEDLRERISSEAKVKIVATPVGDYHEVDKDSVRNVEIILK